MIMQSRGLNKFKIILIVHILNYDPCLAEECFEVSDTTAVFLIWIHRIGNCSGCYSTLRSASWLFSHVDRLYEVQGYHEQRHELRVRFSSARESEAGMLPMAQLHLLSPEVSIRGA